MDKETEDVPALVVGYKRPEKIRLCLENLIAIGVKRIYVAIDGPKGNEDAALVEEVHRVVAEFPSEAIYKVRLAEANRGCHIWVSWSVSWFFSQEEFGMIIEEDVQIDKRFYEWCKKIKQRGVEDGRIMHVNAFYPTSKNLPETTCHLTKYATSSGWATWRRAWEKYDDEMANYLSLGLLGRLFYLKMKIGAGWPVAIHYFLALQMTAQGKLSSWAHRWALSIWSNDGVALSPGINLSSNTGVGAGATHTSNELSLLSYKVASPSAFVSSEVRELDPRIDRILFRNIGRTHNIFKVLRKAVSTIVPNSFFFAVRRFFRD